MVALMVGTVSGSGVSTGGLQHDYYHASASTSSTTRKSQRLDSALEHECPWL